MDLHWPSLSVQTGAGGKLMATDKTAGLEGVIAGDTAIATVGKEGKGLTYRGYSIYDLAEHSTFEEVAYLLIYGVLPTQAELNNYNKALLGMRGLPAPLKTVLEQIPADTHPMDVCAPVVRCSGLWSPKGLPAIKSLLPID
jgi:2-methylcitrate synthase